MSNNEQEDNFHPLRRIGEIINNVHLNQLQDEAIVNCLKAEIEALNEKSNEMKKNRKELEKSNESMKTNIQLLRENYDATLISIQLKQKLRTSLKQLVDKNREELDAWAKRCDETHKDFTRQYEEIKSQRESVSPQYAEYEKTRALAFETQIRSKVMEKNIEALTEKIKLRQKVDSSLANAKIVRFAQAAVNYYKRRDTLKGLQQLETATESNNPVESHEEPVPLHATVPTLAEIEVFTASRLISNYTADNWTMPSMFDESQENMWSKLSVLFEDNKKQWIQKNPSFAKSPYLPKVQSPKRPLAVIDENPIKKVNVISVRNIKESSVSPQISLDKETELGSKSPASIVQFVEPPKMPKTTDSEFSEAVGGVTSVFFEKPKPPTREMVVPQMDTLLTSPSSVDRDMNSSFNEDQYMHMMSPLNISNSNVNMAMSPIATNNGSGSDIVPQFMFNTNQPTVDQQPNQPMSFFTNTASNLFNMFP